MGSHESAESHTEPSEMCSPEGGAVPLAFCEKRDSGIDYPAHSVLIFNTKKAEPLG